MAPKAVLIQAFFEQLFTFLGELKDMYPDDPDFALGVTSVRLLRSANPLFVIKTFYDNAKGFEDEIQNRNEAFFLDHSFENIQDIDFNVLSKLKQYVRGMTDESKKIVWIYVGNLYKLSKLLSSEN